MYIPTTSAGWDSLHTENLKLCWIDRYLLFYAQSNPRRVISGRTEMYIPTTSAGCDSLHTHIPPLRIWRHFEKTKLNEPGMQKQGRHRSPVSRQSIQSYILTHYRLQKRVSCFAPIIYPATQMIRANSVCRPLSHPSSRARQYNAGHQKCPAYFRVDDDDDDN